MSTFIRKAVEIFRGALRGFVDDKCYLHASSLTFYTLLSIVPILAVAFGFAKGFGFEGNLEDELYKRLSEHREIVDLVLDFSRSLLEQAEGSYIAGIGVVFLFLFVISLFWAIEASMNAIWKVKSSRPFARIITDYLAMMIICPFFFVIASSLTVFLTTQIGEAIEQHDVLRQMTPLISLAYRGITLLLIWGLFTCLYIIMPNTRVPARYAISAGVLAGTIYYLVLIAVINFQIGVSQYNAIYGSFAALPLFLFWLQISWLLVLLGAELAYHAEHLSPALKFTKKRLKVTKQLLTILLTNKIVKSFKDGEKQWTLKQLSEHFGVPESHIESAFQPLIDVGMVSEFRSDNFSIHYQPARDIETLTLHTIMLSSNPLITQNTLINDCPELPIITKQIESYENDSEGLESNVPIHLL